MVRIFNALQLGSPNRFAKSRFWLNFLYRKVFRAVKSSIEEKYKQTNFHLKITKFITQDEQIFTSEIVCEWLCASILA